ncbi:CLUMA_CG000800, isoform A [Clunio marinus]|uniref:CLUMA_CG000800, isoform A n=1 Tax=Clunio marinus TaxID=568069 RepID=A0A1J1HGI9_9DIPT|nr:CLUMA_CG000800, isoform A [Clunio marinus]
MTAEDNNFCKIIKNTKSDDQAIDVVMNDNMILRRKYKNNLTSNANHPKTLGFTLNAAELKGDTPGWLAKTFLVK